MSKSKQLFTEIREREAYIASLLETDIPKHLINQIKTIKDDNISKSTDRPIR